MGRKGRKDVGQQPTLSFWMRGKEDERPKRKAEASSPPPSLRQRLAARAAKKEESRPEAQQKLFFSPKAEMRPESVATPCRRLDEGKVEPTESPDVRVAGEAAARRHSDAVAEIERLAPLRQQRWTLLKARAVLGLAADAKEAQAQHAFRGLMRKLHPDRVGADLPGAAEAIEMLQEARQQLLATRQSHLRPPNAPTQLTATVLEAQPGQRRYRLSWRPGPADEAQAPVRRFLVAALDPAYGLLTLRQLEPEYDEALGRFRTVEEISEYELVEEELSKLPSFFQQAMATLRVCAENEVGQSSWSSFSLRLTPPPPAPQERKPPPSKQGKEFEERLRGFLKSAEGSLCLWLRKQSKGLLAAWLRLQGWPTTGSKDELVDRVAFAVGTEKG